MNIVHTPFIVTKQDKRRAHAVRSAEENFVRKEAPRFFVYGNGACKDAGNLDDFTEGSRRIHGKTARQRAAVVCRACPFTADCLAWAITSKQTGVFGAEWLQSGRVIQGMM